MLVDVTFSSTFQGISGADSVSELHHMFADEVERFLTLFTSLWDFFFKLSYSLIILELEPNVLPHFDVIEPHVPCSLFHFFQTVFQ